MRLFQSAGNNIKHLVIPSRSAEGVAAGNDPGGAAGAETRALELNRSRGGQNALCWDDFPYILPLHQPN